MPLTVDCEIRQQCVPATIPAKLDIFILKRYLSNHSAANGTDARFTANMDISEVQTLLFSLRFSMLGVQLHILTENIQTVTLMF